MNEMISKSMNQVKSAMYASCYPAFPLVLEMVLEAFIARGTFCDTQVQE